MTEKPLFDPAFYDYEQQMSVEPSYKHIDYAQPPIFEEPDYEDKELLGFMGWGIGISLTVIIGIIAVAWYYLKYQ